MMAAAVAAGLPPCRKEVSGGTAKGPGGTRDSPIAQGTLAASPSSGLAVSALPRRAAFSGKVVAIFFLLRSTLRKFASQTNGEARVAQILKEKFPQAAAIKVVDISGGCGAMYEIHIESEEFKEKRTVQQHQMVNQALNEEIKAMHGLRIFTSVPKHRD
uniref:bolA-like protein 3 n=1 Tax=Euleptes europaea TaxID=460621 RepID=UPI002540EB23|nr:bolA-like protein 3 [Euleptes europaea]